MKIDFSEIIKKLQMIQDTFNATNDPIDRFALIELTNATAEEIKFKQGGDEWIWKQYHDAMLLKIEKTLKRKNLSKPY